MAILDVVDSTSESPIDSWEIHATEETRDLFSHPSIVAAVADSAGATTPSDIFNAIRTHLASNDKWTDVLHDDVLADVMEDPTAHALIYDYYYLYSIGTTGYRNQSYVLKHKTNVSNRWSANVADVGIDNVYDPMQLLDEVTDPTLWAFPLPYRLQFKLGAIPPLTGPSNYLWGWLKSSSTETTEASNRVNIETDYTLDLWDTNIYPAYP
jgi:hypothetical protein